MRSIGVDIHKDYAYVFELAGDGTKKHCKIPLYGPEMTKFCESLDEHAQVVVEASTNSFRFSEIAGRFAGRVVVCDPAQARGVVSKAAMNDHKAAEALARLLQANFIKEVWLPPAPVRALRCQVSHYMQLNRTRTQTINRVRSLFQQEFIDFRLGTVGPHSHSFLDAQFQEQPELRFYLCSLLRQVSHLNQELSELERSFGSWSRQSPEAQLLMSIPGVAAVVSTVLLAEIGDIRRFPASGKLCSYAGLVPKVHESGTVLQRGGISRAGRSDMRWALNIAVWGISGRSKILDAFRERLRAKRPKMVAQTAACRKLLAVIWSMLTYKRPFRDQDLELNSRKKLRLEGCSRPSPESFVVPKISPR